MLKVLKRCFEINLDEYENIGFSLEINKVVLGVCIALVAGVVFLHVFRGNVRLTIVQLMRHGAKCEDDARTLKELGLGDSRVIKRLLSKDNVLTKTVARVGEVKYDYETYVKMDKKARAEAERIDFSVAKFYVKEDEATRAAFISERYVTSPIRCAVSCLFVVIMTVIVIACMPGILSVVDALIGKMK